MVTAQIHIENEEIKNAIWSVCDPEIPVLSIMDLGVVRSVVVKDKHVDVEITPTYSGCPAMDTIATDTKLAIEKLNYTADVKLVLSPAWNTDWISQEGRKKLEAYGVAAPLSPGLDKRALLEGERIIKCTNCQSTNTVMVSQFGSTACKALFKCEDCLEPFDYFKCLV